MMWLMLFDYDNDNALNSAVNTMSTFNHQAMYLVDRVNVVDPDQPH